MPLAGNRAQISTFMIGTCINPYTTRQRVDIDIDIERDTGTIAKPTSLKEIIDHKRAQKDRVEQRRAENIKVAQAKQSTFTPHPKQFQSNVGERKLKKKEAQSNNDTRELDSKTLAPLPLLLSPG